MAGCGAQVGELLAQVGRGLQRLLQIAVQPLHARGPLGQARSLTERLVERQAPLPRLRRGLGELLLRAAAARLGAAQALVAGGDLDLQFGPQLCRGRFGDRRVAVPRQQPAGDRCHQERDRKADREK